MNARATKMGGGGPLRRLLMWPAHFLGFDANDLRLGFNFARMMLRDRFLGSSLGLIWAVLNPALMLLLFCFVFGVIFRTRLAGNESSLAFVIWLISGYGPWLAISEALSNATHSVVGQGGIVKNMAFKTEILPFASTAVAVVPLAVSFLVLVVLLAVDGRGPNTAWLIMPYVLVMQFALVTGIGLVLAASNVFLRDIGQLLPNVLTLVLFLSPIFYQVSAFPDLVRPLAEWNPFYLVTNGYRQPILNGSVPALAQIVVLTLVSIGALVTGLWYFRRLKTYFSGRI